MRAERFEQFMTGLVREAGVPVRTFAEDGYTARPYGMVLAMPSGAHVYVQFTHGAPAGGDNHDTPERIVEGEPPAPVPAVELPAGQVATADLERWLAALIVNSGSREVASVHTWSDDDEHRVYYTHGVTVRWHNTGEAYLALVHTLPRGQKPVEGTGNIRVLEVV